MKAKIAAFAALLGTCLLGYQGSARAANDSFLLFPFLYGQGTGAGEYDTIIVISNTSADPLGTTPQSGKCALWFYGTNAPASSYVLIGTIEPGTTYSGYVSGLAPDFYGYMIAACNFPYAHGVAKDFASGSLASSTTALSIVTPRPATEENLDN
jgi:hypothetical protein